MIVQTPGVSSKIECLFCKAKRPNHGFIDGVQLQLDNPGRMTFHCCGACFERIGKGDKALSQSTFMTAGIMKYRGLSDAQISEMVEAA